MVDVAVRPRREEGGTPLHDDLAEMVSLMRATERRLFDAADARARDAAPQAGAWSAKDLLAHLAAWRAVEARRMLAASGGPPPPASDPTRADATDDVNAAIQAERATWPWSDVEADAEASATALLSAIGRSSSDILCQCDDDTAGIGVNAVNHAVAHLSDIAQRLDRPQPYLDFARGVESVLRRNHLPPRDSGVVLYNIACHHALAGDMAEARRLLADAFTRRRDLLATARDDPDLAALGAEIDGLAGG